MTRVLLDTTVFVYAVGRGHPQKEPCRDILKRAESGALGAEVSAAMLQELAHQRARRTGDRPGAIRIARSAAAGCAVHEVTAEDALLGLALFERHHRLDALDAVFAATAIRRELAAIVSADRAFDDVPGLRRVDPGDREAVEALAVR